MVLSQPVGVLTWTLEQLDKGEVMLHMPFRCVLRRPLAGRVLIVLFVCSFSRESQFFLYLFHLQALCHERVSQLSCDRQRTKSRSQTDGRSISSFADLDGIYSPVLEYACQWNPVVQTCEYRCNHLYQHPPFRVSEKLHSIRIEAHYVFEQYGAACTPFNIVPVCGMMRDKGR
jgi:hypothetical protein